MTDAAEQPKPTWPAMSIAQAHALLTAPGMPFEMETLDIGGVQIRTWKNAPPTLRSVLGAGRGHGEKVFLVYEDERASFEAFFRAVSALAHELDAQGVDKGDRGRHRHAQRAGVAGRLLRRPGAGRDRNPAERLVDRA